jgi:hypothetical protein
VGRAQVRRVGTRPAATAAAEPHQPFLARPIRLCIVVQEGLAAVVRPLPDLPPPRLVLAFEAHDEHDHCQDGIRVRRGIRVAVQRVPEARNRHCRDGPPSVGQAWEALEGPIPPVSAAKGPLAAAAEDLARLLLVLAALTQGAPALEKLQSVSLHVFADEVVSSSPISICRRRRRHGRHEEHVPLQGRAGALLVHAVHDPRLSARHRVQVHNHGQRFEYLPEGRHRIHWRVAAYFRMDQLHFLRCLGRPVDVLCLGCCGGALQPDEHE